VPNSEVVASLDHLVSAGEKRRRHVQAERLRCLEIDHQFVLGRRLHRKIGRLLALEDAIDIAGRGTVLVDPIGCVGDQAAAGDHVTESVDRGQHVPGRSRDDQITMKRHPAARRHDQAAIPSAGEGRDATFDLASVAHAEGVHLHQACDDFGSVLEGFRAQPSIQLEWLTARLEIANLINKIVPYFTSQRYPYRFPYFRTPSNKIPWSPPDQSHVPAQKLHCRSDFRR
jgi:hypothetical protein